MQVQICARAATLDEALDRLKARREAALKKLAELGAEKDAIEVGSIRMSKMNSTIGYATPYSTYPPATTSLPEPAATYGGVAPSPSYAPSPYVPSNNVVPHARPVNPTYNAPYNPLANPTPPTLSKPLPNPATPAESNDADDRTPAATPPTAYSPPTTTPPATATYPPASSSSGPAYAPPGTVPLPPPASSQGWNSPPAIASPSVPSPPKPYVTVLESVTANWKLSGETQEDLLKESEKLKDKIEEADISGLKSDQKLPSEEESLRSNVVMMPYYPNLGISTVEPVSVHEPPLLPPPGMSYRTMTAYYKVVNCEPKFLFVARVSEKQRKTLEVQAFACAKSQAEALTEAAGCKLGAIQSINLDCHQPLTAPPTIFYGDDAPTDGWYSLEEGIGHEKEIQSYTVSNLYSIFGVVVKYRLQ
jgi:hypothetical protein